MACVVEIANTKHLAFSPMNEKHNMLYNQARHVLYQRYFQRPWFNLNPALDRQTDESIENWKENMEMQPLQSLIVVENYFQECPVQTCELSIAQFWDFLFSDNWSEGYSIRVLEGRLQDIIVAELVSLFQTRYITQHSTFAFAKNKRPRIRVYKHSTNTDALGFIEETLLVEFTYYGHLIRNEYQQFSSSGYQESTTTTPTSFTTSEEISSDCDVGTRIDPRTAPITIKFTNGKTQTKVQTSRSSSARKKKRRSVRISATLEKSIMQGSLPHPPIDSPRSEDRMEHPKRYTKSYSIPCSLSDSVWQLPPAKIDLKKFLCTEKVSYLGEFDLADDFSSDDEKDASDFGQEFYLGDKNIGRFEAGESVITKLKKRKEELLKQRESQKLVAKQPVERRKPLLPQWEAFGFDEVSFGLGDTMRIPPLSPNQKAPSFIDFLDTPGEEADAKTGRSRKVRVMKSKMNTKVKRASMPVEAKQKGIKKKRHYMFFDPSIEPFADLVGGVTDSKACKMHCLNQDENWKTSSDFSKKAYLWSKHRKQETGLKDKVRRRKRQKIKFIIPMIYVTTVNGVTFIHPVSVEQLKAEKKLKRKKIASKRQRISLLLGGGTAKKEIEKKIKKNTTEDGKLFPKVQPVDSDDSSESSSDSGSESSSSDDSSFDTKKLNVRYSIERIKRAVRAKQPKKPQTFHSVLQKYCRMQSILKDFAPKKSTSRRNSVSGAPGFLSSGRPKRKSFITSLLGNLKEEPPLNIGKMKWFPFLDKKPKQAHSKSQFATVPLFENYPMDVFRRNMERALDGFVVRKETVVSDYNAKSSVSITFTKKSIFTKPKYMA